jgi:hypothetical protein
VPGSGIRGPYGAVQGVASPFVPAGAVLSLEGLNERLDNFQEELEYHVEAFTAADMNLNVRDQKIEGDIY